MESLNLNTLVSSLPAAQQNAEKELLNNFKAAALSITTLYRSSRQNAKRAYNAGYATACQDMLNFIQQGVSASSIGSAAAGPSNEVEGGGMTIGRVMDWTEARLDAIKSLEEEEDEDEEREKEKERGRAAAAAPPAPTTVNKADTKKPAVAAPAPSSNRPKDTATSMPAPSSPALPANAQLSLSSSSPSPPPSTTALKPTQKASKTRTPAKGDQPSLHPSQPPSIPLAPFSFISEPLLPPSHSAHFQDAPIVIGAGVKRRHAMMMMLDSGSSTVNISGSSSSPSNGGALGGGSANHNGAGLGRRRTRSSRNLTHQLHAQNQNLNLIQAGPEPMDIEEDGGRERKRVARR